MTIFLAVYVTFSGVYFALLMHLDVKDIIASALFIVYVLIFLVIYCLLGQHLTDSVRSGGICITFRNEY